MGKSYITKSWPNKPKKPSEKKNKTQHKHHSLFPCLQLNQEKFHVPSPEFKHFPSLNLQILFSFKNLQEQKFLKISARHRITYTTLQALFILRPTITPRKKNNLSALCIKTLFFFAE